MDVCNSQRFVRVPKRRRKRREEGAVMLVVMLILLVATASAAVSVQTTQSELHAAGHDRMALQARYAAEAALLATTTWVDDLGASSKWEGLWNGEQAKPPPIMNAFGEPNIPNVADRHFAIRLTQEQQEPQHVGEMVSIGPPGAITDPAPVDLIGSFGPNQAYQPTPFAVDFTDCVPAPAALTPGQPVNSSGPTFVQYYCTLTAHGRVQINAAASGLARAWVYDSVTFSQDAFMAAHDVRAMVLLPEVTRP